jgi:hypothetical protein
VLPVVEPVEALLRRFTPAILALPEQPAYARADLWTSAFRLYQDGRVTVYYAPFGHANPRARIALVGITPGFSQAEIAFRVARHALQAGLDAAEMYRRVTQTAAFAGAMRANLVAMLDCLGAARCLGIPSTATLFTDRTDLLHATSAVRFPVVIDGTTNYAGSQPRLTTHPGLGVFVRSYLVPELVACEGALVIPLGDRVSDVLRNLIDRGYLDRARCAIGFPHPSGANGHRVRQFTARRTELAQIVQSWLASPRQRLPIGTSRSDPERA